MHEHFLNPTLWKQRKYNVYQKMHAYLQACKSLKKQKHKELKPQLLNKINFSLPVLDDEVCYFSGSKIRLYLLCFEAKEIVSPSIWALSLKNVLLIF